VTHVRGEFDSAYGMIVSDWTGTPKGPFALNVTIPANTTATIYLPAIPDARVTESGRAVSAGRGPEGYAVKVGSGSYRFEVK
jgi:alpha-L-rhamnosidase